MDTEKLFRVINDVLRDEQEINIVAFLDQIRNGFAQNNSDGFTTAKNQFVELETKIKESSVSYGFSKTEQEILKNLGDADFFGSGLIAKLNSFLKLQGFDGVSRIDQYKAERTTFIQKIQKLSNDFKELGIKEYRPEKSEIGIILPIEQADADVLQKKIKEFEQLIKAVQELVQSDEKKVKIERVSNGTLEFFTSQPVEVVVVVTTILANISQIWDKIATLKRKKTQTDTDAVLSEQGKTDIKKALDKEINSIKKEIEEKLPQEIVSKFANKDLEDGRKNELRNHIKAKAKVIFAWFEVGIEVDVIPVRVPDTNSTQEVKDELKKVASEIRTTNQLLQKVYSLPQEIKQLPFKLDPEEEVAVTEETLVAEDASSEVKAEETAS